MKLVPIKVKISLRVNGHADHPDWILLPMIKEESDTKQYMPFGWMYDKSCGHQEARVNGDAWDSPTGMQWGCLLVSEAFATEAIDTFPHLVSEISETDFEDFYDNKHMGHQQDVVYDTAALEGLKAEYDLLAILNEDVTEVKGRIAKAINADDGAPGIKRNKNRKWSGVNGRKAALATSVKTRVATIGSK